MNPTLENNQFLLLNKHNKKYERFDIIVFKKKNITYIKRVIGLPTEKVEYKGNKLYINDEIIEENFEHYYTKDILFNAENKFVIPDNAYIVLGDNRIDSIDSRSFGIVNEKEIIGKVILK